MPIPLVDLSFQHRQIEEEVREEFDRIMRSGAFILGPPVGEFEEAYARFCEVEHCIGVGSGTDALELALRALEVGAGDEVILPANTFVASAVAVVRVGATPVLVDSEPDFHLIDVDQVGARIGPKTKAVMPVDLFGQVPRMAELEALAGEAGIALLEDAAQSQGARRLGRAAGSFGQIAGTSFYPGKNLGAYGDGGAVLTRSGELAARVKRLRNYGSEVKYQHPEVGFNSRLDSLQAVVLNAKLAHLREWNRLRQEAAARYDELLAGMDGVTAPRTLPGNEHVWHVYAVRVPQRDSVLGDLLGAGIGAGVHYPTPVHLHGAFADLGHREGDFPAAERAAAEILSLPLFPGISEDQQSEVARVLERAVASARG